MSIYVQVLRAKQMCMMAWNELVFIEILEEINGRQLNTIIFLNGYFIGVTHLFTRISSHRRFDKIGPPSHRQFDIRRLFGMQFCTFELLYLRRP